jgi:hypothetical protein
MGHNGPSELHRRSDSFGPNPSDQMVQIGRSANRRHLVNAPEWQAVSSFPIVATQYIFYHYLKM